MSRRAPLASDYRIKKPMLDLVCDPTSEGINSDRTPENNNRIKEILFGSLLGDGRLEMPPRGINARFGFTQSEAQKDYFIFVNSLLSSYVDKRTGKTYKSLNF
jgi:hypothetical protein